MNSNYAIDDSSSTLNFNKKCKIRRSKILEHLVSVCKSGSMAYEIIRMYDLIVDQRIGDAPNAWVFHYSWFYSHGFTKGRVSRYIKTMLKHRILLDCSIPANPNLQTGKQLRFNINPNFHTTTVEKKVLNFPKQPVVVSSTSEEDPVTKIIPAYRRICRKVKHIRDWVHDGYYYSPRVLEALSNLFIPNDTIMFESNKELIGAQMLDVYNCISLDSDIGVKLDLGEDIEVFRDFVESNLEEFSLYLEAHKDLIVAKFSTKYAATTKRLNNIVPCRAYDDDSQKGWCVQGEYSSLTTIHGFEPLMEYTPTLSKFSVKQLKKFYGSTVMDSLHKHQLTCLDHLKEQVLELYK